MSNEPLQGLKTSTHLSEPEAVEAVCTSLMTRWHDVDDTHAPAPLQDWPDAQAAPQLPQLFVSLLVLTSQPSAGFLLQSAKPALHDVMAQLDALHVAVALAKLHAAPHDPQFLESVCRLVQAPLQLVNPDAQPQTPMTQVAEDTQSEFVLQPPPVPHGGHTGPPQSTPVSCPSLTRSVQVGVWQTPATQTLGDTQSLSAAHDVLHAVAPQA
jgi:hypothetical protein